MTRAEPLAIGVVGAGAVGQMHMHAFASSGVGRVVGLADLRPELRTAVARRLGVPRVYGSHLELLEDRSVSAVVVATRRDATSAVVLDCLEAGKHVLSEKPMAMTLEEARRLAAAATRKQVRYRIAFQKRSDPGTRIFRERLHRCLATSELGKLLLIRAWNYTGKDRLPDDHGIVMTEERKPAALRQGPRAPDWLPARLQDSYDRFVNSLSHDVNMLHHLLDGSPEVQAAALDPSGAHVIILQYPRFACVLECCLGEHSEWSMRGQWDEGMEALFEGGRLRIRFAPPLYSGRCAQVEFLVADREPEILCHGEIKDSLFSLQARRFVEDVLAEREPEVSGERCVQDMLLIEKIWRVGLRSPEKMPFVLAARDARMAT